MTAKNFYFQVYELWRSLSQKYQYGYRGLSFDQNCDVHQEVRKYCDRFQKAISKEMLIFLIERELNGNSSS